MKYLFVEISKHVGISKHGINFLKNAYFSLILSRIRRRVHTYEWLNLVWNHWKFFLKYIISQHFKQYLSGRYLWGTDRRTRNNPPQILYPLIIPSVKLRLLLIMLEKNRFQDIALSICLKVFFNFERKIVLFFTRLSMIHDILVKRISSWSKVFISNFFV